MLATALHFVSGEHWNAATYVGIGAAVLIFLCAVFLLGVESDASEEIEHARKAVTIAKNAEENYKAALDEYAAYRQHQTRICELYLASMSMREALEVTLGRQDVGLEKIITSMLETAKRSLRIACDFQSDQHHTICIYRARPAQTHLRFKTELVLIAHDRSVECDIAEAQVWPSGVGAGGYSHAVNEEVIVSDLSKSPFAGDHQSQNKNAQTTLYRSLIAVPIRPGKTGEPWGIAVGTSNEVGHFMVSGEPGVHPAEGIRALAGMVALAVRAHCGAVRKAAGSREGEPKTDGGPQPSPALHVVAGDVKT